MIKLCQKKGVALEIIIDIALLHILRHKKFFNAEIKALSD